MWRSDLHDGDGRRADEGGDGAERVEGCAGGIQVEVLERNTLNMFGNEKIERNVRNIGPWDLTGRGLVSPRQNTEMTYWNAARSSEGRQQAGGRGANARNSRKVIIHVGTHSHISSFIVDEVRPCHIP